MAEVRPAIQRYIKNKRGRKLMHMKEPRLKELIYAVHPLKDPDEVATVFRVVDEDSGKRRIFALPFRSQDRKLVVEDAAGLIPPMHGRLGKGLVNLGGSLFLGYVLEYGRSFTSRVRSVKVVEKLREGRRKVDLAPLCNKAFMVINRQRNADSVAVIVRGKGGRKLERIRVDIRVVY
jgi:hypothetical protein